MIKPQILLKNGSVIEADAVQFKNMGDLQIVICSNPKDIKSKMRDLLPSMLFPMASVVGVGLDKDDPRAQM